MRGKIIIILNTAWNLVNFRSSLIRALSEADFEVVAVAPPDEYVIQLSELPCRYLPLPMDNKGTHPGRDLLLLLRFFRLFQAEKPDVVLGFTIKPNVYGSLAAHALGIPVINNIAGLGSVFNRGGWLNFLVKKLYKLALSKSVKVFFQNKEDRQLFESSGLVATGVTDLLPGSGVNLKKFFPQPLPDKTTLRFLLIARMLWEKGVGEFVQAAHLLQKRGLNAEFCLLGFLDVENPAAISRGQMDQWVAEGAVRYLGVSDKVYEEIAQADCIVLPSYYREGVPRTLLEAAAMARPIVTTYSVGCREAVKDGSNGYLCHPKDAMDLADKIFRIAALSSGERTAMGLQGREKVEREFDEQIVIQKYVQVVESVMKK